jgi:glycosyltransferase involved in cell wall biosynthesis
VARYIGRSRDSRGVPEPGAGSITVVTATLNARDELRRTVERMAEVKRSGVVEWIVVDGGSRDGTVELLREASGVVDAWLSEPDRGIADAWNKGVALARGELVGFLGAGDWYEEGCVGLVLGVAAQTGADIIHGHMRVWEAGAARPVGVRLAPTDVVCLRRYMCVNHPACFVRRSLLERVGPFATRYKIAADYEWLLRAYLMGGLFATCDGVLVNHVLGGVSSRLAVRGLLESWWAKRDQGLAALPASTDFLVLTARHLIRELIVRAGGGLLVKWYRQRTARWHLEDVALSGEVPGRVRGKRDAW